MEEKILENLSIFCFFTWKQAESCNEILVNCDNWRIDSFIFFPICGNVTKADISFLVSTPACFFSLFLQNKVLSWNNQSWFALIYSVDTKAGFDTSS